MERTGDAQCVYVPIGKEEKNALNAPYNNDSELLKDLLFFGKLFAKTITHEVFKKMRNDFIRTLRTRQAAAKVLTIIIK